MRIWQIITAKRWLGHVHGINNILGHWQPGNLIIHCPVCPEPNFNMEPGWQNTPFNLRHLHQTTFTAESPQQICQEFWSQQCLFDCWSCVLSRGIRISEIYPVYSRTRSLWGASSVPLNYSSFANQHFLSRKLRVTIWMSWISKSV